MSKDDIPIEDILAEIGDDHYRKAQAAELDRLESALAGLGTRFQNTLENPHIPDEEKGVALAQMSGEIRMVHWAIKRMKERQQAASEAIRGKKAVD